MMIMLMMVMMMIAVGIHFELAMKKKEKRWPDSWKHYQRRRVNKPEGQCY